MEDNHQKAYSEKTVSARRGSNGRSGDAPPRGQKRAVPKEAGLQEMREPMLVLFDSRMQGAKPGHLQVLGREIEVHG